MSAQRVLPAHVYDALQVSALMYGGIGAGESVVGIAESFGKLYETNPAACVPFCIRGHAWCAGVLTADMVGDVMFRADFPIHYAANDNAVLEINARKGVHDRRARVTFEEWCAELNVVRGPESPTVVSRNVSDATPETFSVASGHGDTPQ